MIQFHKQIFEIPAKKDGDGFFQWQKEQIRSNFMSKFLGFVGGESDSTSSRLQAYHTLLEMIPFRKAFFFKRAPHTDIKGCKCGWQLGIIFAFSKRVPCLGWEYFGGLISKRSSGMEVSSTILKDFSQKSIKIRIGMLSLPKSIRIFSHTFL